MINHEDTTIQIPVAGVHPEVYSLNVLYGQVMEPRLEISGIDPKTQQSTAPQDLPDGQ